MAHLINNADAFAQVTTAALVGEQRETYPGGQAARDEAIERDAGRPAGEALAELRRAQADLLELWASRTPSEWRLPVTFRNGTLAHLLASRWREVEIHHVDLLVDYEPARWSTAVSQHAIEFLFPRLARAGSVELTAADTGRQFRQGPPPHVQVQGLAHQLAAWLSGRSSGRGLSVSEGGLPPLDPWP